MRPRALGPSVAPCPAATDTPRARPLEIRHGTDSRGRSLAIVTGIGIGIGIVIGIDAEAYSIDLRRWAAQLNAAADMLEAYAS